VQSTEALKPFAGYAYFFRAGEELTWDPLARSVAAKSGSSLPEAVALRASFSGTAAEIRLGRDQGEIPGLPAAGTALDLRVGPGSGFWRRNVALEGFAESLVLTSPAAGKAEFTFRSEGAQVEELVLWNPASGLGYRLSESGAVPVSTGENRFLLIGGTSGYVQRRLQNLQSELPTALQLSAWANTREGLRIRVQLPPKAGGYGRLSVFLHDAQGRRLLAREFGQPRPGKGDYHLAVNLRPGLYFCRIRIHAAGPYLDAVRKVAVTP
jgi:hypothetical protein